MRLGEQHSVGQVICEPALCILDACIFDASIQLEPAKEMRLLNGGDGKLSHVRLDIEADRLAQQVSGVHKSLHLRLGGKAQGAERFIHDRRADGAHAAHGVDHAEIIAGKRSQVDGAGPQTRQQFSGVQQLTGRFAQAGGANIDKAEIRLRHPARIGTIRHRAERRAQFTQAMVKVGENAVAEGEQFPAGVGQAAAHQVFGQQAFAGLAFFGGGRVEGGEGGPEGVHGEWRAAEGDLAGVFRLYPAGIAVVEKLDADFWDRQGFKKLNTNFSNCTNFTNFLRSYWHYGSIPALKIL